MVGIAANQLVPPGCVGHYDGLKDTYQRHDPEQAKRLLADAGYPGGKGFPQIRWTYRNVGPWKTIVQTLVAQVKETLGIEIPLDEHDPTSYFGLFTKVETFPTIAYISSGQTYPGPQTWCSDGVANGAAVGWRSGHYDQIANQADHELDQNKRTALYKEAAQLLSDEVPWAFVYWSQSVLLLKPWLTGLSHLPEAYLGQHSLSTMRSQRPG